MASAIDTHTNGQESLEIVRPAINGAENKISVDDAHDLNGSSLSNPNAAPKERVHSEQHHVTIICVGAGVAGLITAYEAQKHLKNFTLVIYDKNDDVGGTWYENIYPGVGCDVPSHSYTFGFEASTDWDGFYPSGQQVQKYFSDFCEKYGLRKYIQFETTVTQAQWRDDLGQWQLQMTKSSGISETAYCNVLINGTGPLNKWKWPTIDGLHDFGGTLVHTAKWDPSIGWSGKRVGVIGNGSSGIQIVPQLAKGSQHLTVFAKSPQWIVPPVAWQDIRVIPDSPDSAMPAPQGKHRYSQKEKEIFRADPERFLCYRKAVDSPQQERFSAFLKHHPAHDMVNGMVSDLVEQRLGHGDADWKQLYRPNFSIGCKRPTPGDDFLETLQKPWVASVTTPISKVVPDGIVTADGHLHELDILVCATGFDVGFAPHFEVIGLHGKVMKHEWQEAPQCYLSVASPNFPNLFFIGGPTGNWSYGTIPVSHEVQAEYAIQCAAKISIENLHSVAPRENITSQWIQHVNKWHREKSVFSEGCSSWMKYKGNIQLWPGSFFNMLHTLRQPRWEDYDIVRRDKTPWSFLGDGRTEREIMKENGIDVDMAPFMRSKDTPWTIDV